MTVPPDEAVSAWTGKTVIDVDGQVLGVCTRVLPGSSPSSGWVHADVDGTTRHLPLAGAAMSGGVVRVAVPRSAVLSAPGPSGSGEPSAEDLQALDRHYNSYLTDASSGRAGGDRTSQAAIAVGGLVGLGALIGAIVRVVMARRRARQAPLSRLARAGRAATDTANTAVAASLPVLVAGAELAAKLGSQATEVGGKAALSGARTATSAAGTALRALAGTATSAGKAASSVVDGLGSAAEGSLSGAHRVSGAVAAVPATVAEQGRQLHKRWRKLVRTVKFVLGLGVGFVLGARAGRERYEELKEKATNLLQRPEVQQGKDRLQQAGQQQRRSDP